MGKFQWRLQRVLDVTEQRESAVRAELYKMSGEIAAVENDIRRREDVTRSRLKELSGLPMPERMQYQKFFMSCADMELKSISQLHDKVKELEARRESKMKEMMQIRAARQTLERLRNEARRRYLVEVRRQEQKQLDESAQISFVRNAMPLQDAE